MASKKVMKRKAAQSITHLVDSANAITELREIFIEAHPEYAEFFDFTVTGICVMIDELKKVYAKAWGYFPNDVTSWLH
jgi:hypothetical protein